MKSEHRHELETNELSKELAVVVEKVKPHTTSILAAIGVLIGAYAAVTWWSASRAARDRQFWEAFQVQVTARDPEYKNILRLAESEEYRGSPGQEWAYIAWADRQMLLASQEYLQSRDDAKKRLNAVEGIYDTLASSATSNEIVSRARFGLGRVHEMQGDIEAAAAQYAMVTGPMAGLASSRAEQLQSESNKAAADWLLTADLPQRPAVPGAAGISDRPEFDVDTPSSESGDAAGPNFDASKSLNEILNELTAGEGGDDRYDGSETGDDAASAEADETGDSQGETSSDADAASDQ